MTLAHPPTTPAGPPAGPFPADDGLVLHLRLLDHAVVLELAGDLDLASAPRLAAALTWLRWTSRRVVVVDTRGLAFVDLAGYRALGRGRSQRGGRGVGATGRAHTIYVLGDVLTRLERHLAACRP